jgi:hypothetical protein
MQSRREPVAKFGVARLSVLEKRTKSASAPNVFIM